ncbi:MAG: DNA polymerase III subunit alpha [Turicibacter sanguinis]|uniref:DNA polymerase III subunit alpha n=1 Tax=Turicibacter sanguinis TaxID=154288 RepID=UPI0018970CB3|nr:DNA polymerase III subunit alpha [Turicibacter sanguinis]
MSFVHLQVRSAYSLLSSSIKIKELVDLALENQMSCLALVEEGTMHSAIKFYNACRRVNVKPLIGMSVNVQGDSFIDEWVILARNQCGYQGLLKIASFIVKQEGVVLYEQVLPFVQDLVVITSGEHGMLCSGIEEYKEERLLQYYESYLKSIPHLYIGLMRVNQRTYELSKHLISFASNVNRPIVALNDVRYLKKEDAKTLTLLQAIKQNQSVEELPLVDYERYFKSECQMKELFADVPNALMQTEQIANDCEVEIPLHQSLLPKYQTPEGVSSDSYLEALCFKGLEKRYGHLEYANRLKYELSVIHKMGFSDYFLIVWDFVRYAKSHDIYVGPGRGSAAGSLVAYVLGITNVDPIKYELLFERFLNPERITMPDIDIDFQDNRRDEVIQYVQNKYGSHCVVQIATFGTFQSRSAWRDLARVHQVETTLINKVASFIYSGSTLKEIYEQTKGLRDFFSTYPKLEAIYKEAEKIEGLPRHTSIHAAGVIISDHDLTDYTAIMEGPTGIYVSQYEAEDLEMIGLLKMDFLGLKNLNMLQQITTLIKSSVAPEFDINKIPYDDLKTYEMISQGQTTGVFQLESEGMRQVLRAVRPNCLEDIIACNALFRPGPMEGIPLFAARKHHEQPIEYYHPSLQYILSKTYGIIVYQEQIMQIANVVSGYSLGEADVLRRAVSKKKKEILEREQKTFVEKAIERGYHQEIATQLYELILKFANYGFNRSHAVAYSMIAYQMAYLKRHYPSYFMTVALSNVIGSESNTAQYVKEAKQLDILVLPPSINSSGLMYQIENENIRFSLLPIKHIGMNLARQIVAERERGLYKSFYDFVSRTRSFLNQRAYEGLIDVGAMDEFGYNRTTLHHNLTAILDFSKYDGGLFETDFEIMMMKETLSSAEKMKREKELLGFYLNSHPIHLMRDQAKEKGWYFPSDLIHLNVSTITCVGFVEKFREIRDKKGKLMAFMDISDENGTVSVTIFSDVYKSEYKALLGKIVVINGRVSIRNSEKNINLSKIIAIS